MRIPKKIKIGGITYKVKQVDKINHCFESNNTTVGLWEPSEAIIYIDQNLEEQVKMRYFLHEVFHAIFDHCNIEQAEDKVDLLAAALHMVIVDNPKLFSE